MGSNDNIRSTFGPKGQPTPVVRKSVQVWCQGRNPKDFENVITSSKVRALGGTLAHLLNFRQRPHRAESAVGYQAA
jgi:hypothetical protein